MDYLQLHVLSPTVLFGTGIGSALYLLTSSTQRDPRVVAAAAGKVVIAGWLFTASTAVLQPATGFYRVHLAQIPWRLGRLVGGAVCGRDRVLAASGLLACPALDALGVPAFFAFLAVVYPMVVSRRSDQLGRRRLRTTQRRLQQPSLQPIGQ